MKLSYFLKSKEAIYRRYLMITTARIFITSELCYFSVTSLPIKPLKYATHTFVPLMISENTSPIFHFCQVTFIVCRGQDIYHVR